MGSAARARIRLPGTDVPGAGGARRLPVDRRGRPCDLDGLLDASHARHLKAELHGRLDAALALGTGALVATAFLAVGREGLETALFVWASVHAASDGTPRPLIGVALGLATAVLLGWLF